MVDESDRWRIPFRRFFDSFKRKRDHELPPLVPDQRKLHKVRNGKEVGLAGHRQRYGRSGVHRADGVKGLSDLAESVSSGEERVRVDQQVPDHPALRLGRQERVLLRGILRSRNEKKLSLFCKSRGGRKVFDLQPSSSLYRKHPN